MTIGLVILFTGRLWKQVRTSHAITQLKIMAVADKLGVSDADFEAVVKKMRGEPASWALFKRDFRDLGIGQ